MTANTLTQERLKELFKYKEGMLIRTVSTTNCVKIGDAAGYCAGGGYLKVEINGKSYFNHRLIWLYHHGSFPKDQIDHINHIRNDNRIENLRCVTSSENSKNASIRKDNVSGICGVNWNNLEGKWRAYMKLNSKQKHLGCFDNIFDAACARKSAELKYGFHENHGDKNYDQ